MVGALTGRKHQVEDRARDLLLLDSLPGVGPARVSRLVRAFGGAASALEAPYASFAKIAGRKAALARSDRALSDRIDRALDRADELGITVLTWSAPGYPGDLLHLADPPPVLFLRGRIDLLARTPAVTVVGSRRVTTRGREIARDLGRALARPGAVVVSGLALGTDGEAHRGALDVEGDTIAVLGTGADVPYPRTHARLFQELVERGLVVSEFVPGTGAAPYHFPRRNRLLAALGCTAVVVVEAGARSGSLITVDHALDLGRDVWAVPGPIDGPACAGSNALLADGARPLVSIEGFVSDVVGLREEERDHGGRAALGAVDPEASLLQCLSHEPLAPGELADRVGRPLPDVLAALTTLELRGEVVRLPGLRYRRAA
jgi:DNA processing protein